MFKKPVKKANQRALETENDMLVFNANPLFNDEIE